MTKIKSMYFQLATFLAVILNFVLFISSNTNSCAMIYQEKAPKALERYSRIK